MTAIDHTKSCRATAAIAAIENFRDDETIDELTFSHIIGGLGGRLHVESTSYLDGYFDMCRCRVSVLNRVTDFLEQSDCVRAQSYATSELQCGVITRADYAAFQAIYPIDLWDACIHPGVFAPSESDDATAVHCDACDHDIPVSYL